MKKLFQKLIHFFTPKFIKRKQIRKLKEKEENELKEQVENSLIKFSVPIDYPIDIIGGLIYRKIKDFANSRNMQIIFDAPIIKTGINEDFCSEINLLDTNRKIRVTVYGRDLKCIVTISSISKNSQLMGELEEFIKSSVRLFTLKGNYMFTAVVKRTMFGNYISFVNKPINVHKKLYLNKDVEFILNRFVKPAFFKPLNKQTLLFSGPYGTSKTETAYQLCLEKETSLMIYIEDVSDLVYIYDCFSNSPLLSSVYFFIEDIDLEGAGEERSGTLNHIMNTLDGVTTKGKPFRTILTTNNPQILNKGLIRPGRVDYIIYFGNPDEECRQRIFSSKLTDDNLIKRSVELCSGKSTAFCFNILNKMESSNIDSIEELELLVKSFEYHESLLVNTEVEKTTTELFTEFIMQKLNDI